jgi:TatD DNase family protein
MVQSQYQQAVELRTLNLTPELSDAHCHLSLFPDPAQTIADARKGGVGIFITCGCNDKENVESIRIADASEGVFGVIGISPEFAGSHSRSVKGLEALVKSSSKVVGIGEIGLDVKASEKASLDVQRAVFEAQLDIAKDLGLPVVIHSRGCLDETAKILDEKGIRNAIFHFFEGGEEQAKGLSQKGHLISIPPVETGRRKRVIKNTSLNSIVVETDSPVVGRTPADVLGVCKEIAEIKGVSLEEVAAATTENIRRHFYI